MRLHYHLNRLFVGLLAVCVAADVASAAEKTGRKVDFNRDIRPLLSDTCFTCHGPDKSNRKTELRFDIEESVRADLGGGRRTIVPGDPDRSELYRRVSSKDEALRMPPVYSDRKLTEPQIELLKTWIEQGAQWQQHWSLIPPKRPPLPAVKNSGWVRNGIDSFVLQRLEREGLAPSPEAERATLLRRVTLDLTGLPPTPSETNAFLSDKTPSAYEKVVDRLLASPRYGERMAIRWLEAARYADTNGYQTDAARIMWRWRDWVIGAYNRNMPFNQFTIEQLAGDLLPNATLEQKIATAFNRNHRGNGEGGIIAAEYAVEYVVDRVETTSTVWLGLTMGCARCHDHKYDPLTQKEFYKVYAFFNNVPESGKAFKYGNSPPFILSPTPEQQKRLQVMDQKSAAAKTRARQLEPELATAQASWEKTLRPTHPIHWAPTDRLLAHFPLDASIVDRTNREEAIRGDFLEGKPNYVLGRIGLAASFDGKRFISAGDVGDFGFYDRFSIGAWILPSGSQGGAIVSRAKEISQESGYSLMLDRGKVQLNLVLRWLDDALRVETAESLVPNEWHHVMATYDGSRVAQGVKIYVDGKPAKLNVLLDELNQTFKTTEPFRIGSGGGPESRFHGSIDDVRVYQRALSADEVAVAADSDALDRIAAIPAARRTAAQGNKIRGYFLETAAPSHIRSAYDQLSALSRERERLMDSIPTTMVMQEMQPRRDAFVLVRGAYDRPGEKVAANIPASLPPMPAGSRDDRLGFARWLVDPGNPLTTRVTVNRFWQMFFGTGLVKTVEDFGSQGDAPSHPELLDWLATEFASNGWDVKGLLRTLVTSATYRQSSRLTPELLQKDPENRLLARGPRVRLPPEMIRDQALAASGLLVEKIGGPSVKPYQPAGLWKELSGSEDYQPDSGESLHRRSLYTFWKRAAPPPSMMNFDSAGRETCIVRETRTNTPLQALNLMNDVAFVEAARALAQRVMIEGPASSDGRLALAFQLATGRAPKSQEQKVLLAGFERHSSEYRSNPKAALDLLANSGEFPFDERLDVCELAAFTTQASLILNLDEIVTKE
ncbi:MAG: DUF1553 domain-containing protein [Acidimicrobiia bacterium]|nr:DUF1553 domain-containing protein [Acidimicrobiia bacterium]